MTTHKHTAGLVLAGCLAGTAATYNLQYYYIGELLYHGFLAASIGGLADWYAVTALFRKPLGVVSWRTEVIPKNRERLMEALQSFVCQDLLSTDNVMQCLEELSAQKQLSFSSAISNHLSTLEGMSQLKQAILPLLSNALLQLDKSDVEARLQEKLSETVTSLYLTDLALDAVRSSLNNNCAEPLFKQLAKDVDRILDEPKIAAIIEDLLTKAAENYKAQGTMRSMAMSFANLDYAQYTKEIISWLHGQLQTVIEDSNHPVKLYLRDYLVEQLVALQQKRDWVEAMDKKLLDLIQDKADAYLQSLLAGVSDNQEAELGYLVETYAYKFIGNVTYQQKLDQWIMQGARELLERNHQVLEKLVEEKLSDYTTEEIVELIESRVGDDLQLIRVNGSLIGGLVGMALFVISSLVKGAL